jgi:sugar phosphate isomerase/epimerase
MKSAITICLVPEARSGPFVFHDGLVAGCRVAADLGFDGVEIFPESAAALDAAELMRVVAGHGLAVAAVGTGAGWVRHRLHLCDPDAAARARAEDFIAAIVDRAGECGGPAIIGSMQGRSGEGMARDAALDHLAAALGRLGDRAARHGQSLLYEPLNRYETDLFNHQGEAAAFLADRGLSHVRLLADLFHMNIEEADLPAALRAAGGRVGHVHWADSNRRAMGLGHTDPAPVVAALREIGYQGWLSAEVFPLPTAAEAAARTIASVRRHVADSPSGHPMASSRPTS